MSMICKVCGKPGREYGSGLVYCDRCLRVTAKILEAGEKGLTRKEVEEIVRTYYVEMGSSENEERKEWPRCIFGHGDCLVRYEMQQTSLLKAIQPKGEEARIGLAIGAGIASAMAGGVVMVLLSINLLRPRLWNHRKLLKEHAPSPLLCSNRYRSIL